MTVWGVSVDTTILHTFLSAPACTDTQELVKNFEKKNEDVYLYKSIYRPIFFNSKGL